MKVCIIGATGLLGYAGALELISRGHSVSGLTLPPAPDGLEIPGGLKLKYGNYMEMSDAELRTYLKGYEGLVFAAGVDERVEGKPPIYKMFQKYNVDSLRRLLDIARDVGVKKVVVLGSYFSHFAKIWPDLELARHHPYIRSRIAQEKMALSFAEDGMDVAVLELPYIFGAQKGRKPVWLFIAEMIKNTKGQYLFYPKGGTTMVTVKQVGECIAGALTNTQGAKAYPVGWHNMSWKRWLGEFSAGMGMPKKVISVPTFLYKITARQIANDTKKRGFEPGLDMVEFAKVMTAETYIDKHIIQAELGVRADDIDKAIRQSATACLEILDHPEQSQVDMKAE